MKIPHGLKIRLSPLAEVTLGRPLVEPFLEVTESSEARLVLESTYGTFVFDRLARVVLKDGAPVIDFDAVQSVEISAMPGREESRSWALVLYVSFFKRFTVGRTADDGDASVIAARIASVLGCKVLSMQLRRR